MYCKEKDKQIIGAWETACIELGIEIITPFIINLRNEELKFPVFVKNFGRKKGTIIVQEGYLEDHTIPRIEDYFFSALNPEVYSEFNKDLFIETLIDWGYFGSQKKKPKWLIDI